MANYPQYPQAAQPSEPPGPPSSIVNAVRLMYAGAAVQAISVIVSLATIHSLKTIIEQRNPTFDATRVNRLVNATVVLVIFFGLIGIGLWLWMAWANRRGRSWARIVSTVFFGLASIGLLIGFTQAATVVSRIISIVSWAIGLAAVVFLWQRQSSDYYDARKQAVYAPLPYGQPGPPGQPYGQPPSSQPGQPPNSTVVSRSRTVSLISTARPPDSTGRRNRTGRASGTASSNRTGSRPSSMGRRNGGPSSNGDPVSNVAVRAGRPARARDRQPDDRAVTMFVTARSRA